MIRIGWGWPRIPETAETDAPKPKDSWNAVLKIVAGGGRRATSFANAIAAGVHDEGRPARTGGDPSAKRRA